jgi:hypothetical protein
LEKLSFDSKLPHGESFQPSGLFEGHQGSLVRGQSLADGAGLLWAQVQGDVLLALKKNIYKVKSVSNKGLTFLKFFGNCIHM